LGRHRANAGGFVLVSFCYVLLRWLLECVALRARSSEFKDLEIVVLRHELAILRRTRRGPPIPSGAKTWARTDLRK
jgi:hypothetical protein